MLSCIITSGSGEEVTDEKKELRGSISLNVHASVFELGLEDTSRFSGELRTFLNTFQATSHFTRGAFLLGSKLLDLIYVPSIKDLIVIVIATSHFTLNRSCS